MTELIDDEIFPNRINDMRCINKKKVMLKELSKDGYKTYRLREK